MVRKLFAELTPLGVFWMRNGAFSPPARCLEVHSGVRCDVPSDARAAPGLVPAAELPHVMAVRSLKISRGLGGKEVFAVCQGGGAKWGVGGKAKLPCSHTGGSRELEKL